MERRSALAMLGAVPVSGALGGVYKNARAATALDPNDPEDLYTIYRKLDYTFDDRTVFWYLKAVRYVLVDYAFYPMWNMNVGYACVVKDREGAEGFTADVMSAIFYTDLETDAYIETLRNPVTGETVPVRQPSLNVSTRVYDKSKAVRDMAEREGYKTTSQGDIGPAWIVGDDVWCQADTAFRMEPTGSDGRLTQVNDWSYFIGSAAEVADPDVKGAEATWSFNDINTLPSWLDMNDVEGHYVSRGFGRKVWSMDDMPPLWVKLMHDIHPDAAKDPRATALGG